MTTRTTATDTRSGLGARTASGGRRWWIGIVLAALTYPGISQPDQRPALPPRAGPPTQTTGSVPHQQIGVVPVPDVVEELVRRALLLPDVEKRPTIVSLPGALGVWLADGVAVVRPETIVAGREFTHIHPDGSLHAPLPLEVAEEAVAKGWAERHPWANRRAGWEGLVMLFTPRSLAELEVTVSLVVASYNHVTGRSVSPADIR